MSADRSEIVVIRHGETEWSASGRHTSRTDVPLTAAGRAEAEGLRERLAGWDFALVLTSPMRRARDTARLCGLGDVAVVSDDLVEYDYGESEGRSTEEIRRDRPGWTVWAGCPGGETVEEVGARVDRVLGRAAAVEGPVAIFGHGHSLRVLIARWLELAPVEGRRFALGTAGLAVLGHEREIRVLRRLDG